jgi:protein TonB
MRITNELASRVSSNGSAPRVMTASDVLSWRAGPAVAGAIAAAAPAGGDIGTIRPGAGRAKAARAPSVAPRLWIEAIALSLGFHAFAVVAFLVWPAPAPEPATPDVIPVEIVVEKSLPDEPPAAPAPVALSPPVPPPLAPTPPSSQETAKAPPSAVETPLAPGEVPPPAVAPPDAIREETPPMAPPAADHTPVPEALSPTPPRNEAATPAGAAEIPPVRVEVPPPAVMPPEAVREESNPTAPAPAAQTPVAEAPPPAPSPSATEASPVLVEVPPVAVTPPPVSAALKAPLAEKIAPRTGTAPREPAPAPVRPVKAVPASPRNPPSRAAAARTGSPDAAKPAQAARQSSGAAAAEAAEYQQAVIARLSAVKHYPDAARDRAPHGVAIVSFSIGASGSVGAVSIAQSAGDPALDAEAVATVRRASPFPAPPNGAPRTYSAPLSFRVR